jgi:hypothetical protein
MIRYHPARIFAVVWTSSTDNSIDPFPSCRIRFGGRENTEKIFLCVIVDYLIVLLRDPPLLESMVI